MTDDNPISEVDPNAKWCPWCRKVRRWKGRHAAAKHPEKWAQFKDYFKREQGVARTRWVPPE